jgi:hypothetical protein
MAGGHLFTDQIEAAAAHDDALPADSPDRLLDNNGNFVGSPSFAQSTLDHKDIKCFLMVWLLLSPRGLG